MKRIIGFWAIALAGIVVALAFHQPTILAQASRRQLSTEKQQQVDALMRSANRNMMIAYICLAVVLFAAVGYLVVFFLQRKKRQKHEEEPDTPQAPQAG